jgi:hypothetical protein
MQGGINTVCMGCPGRAGVKERVGITLLRGGFAICWCRLPKLERPEYPLRLEETKGESVVEEYSATTPQDTFGNGRHANS